MKISRQSEMWEKVIKYSLDVIGTIDQDGNITSINEACKAVFGYEKEEVVGRHFKVFIYPDDLTIAQDAVLTCINGAKLNNREYSYLHKNGQEVFMSWSMVWCNEDEVVLFVGREITSLKMARQKEALNHALAEHGSDMVALLDKNLYYGYIGNSVYKELGFLPGQLLGTCAIDYIHPEDIPVVEQSVSEVLSLENKEVKIPDFRFKNSNGEWRWIETIVSNQFNNPAVQALVTSSRDITERVKNKIELQESQQRFSSLFKHHQDFILFQDPAGVIMDVNPAAISFFGYPKQENLGKPFADFISPLVVPICENALQDALKGQWVRLEMVIPFEGKGNCVFDIIKIPVIVNNEVIGVYSILKDITEITNSNNTIKQQAKKLSAIFESITDAFFTLDKDWKLTYINSEFDRLLNTNREKIIGRNIWDVFPEEAKGTFYKQYSQAFETGEAVHFDAYLERANLWLQVKAFPSEEGLSVYFDDITEKIKSREELEKLSLVASKTTNGVMIMGADGLIEWVNEGFTKLTGFDYAEVVGIHSCSVLHGEETDKVKVKKINKKAKEGKAFKEEILNYKKSGEKIWFLLDMTPVLDEKGEVTRLLVIQIDITLSKEAEENQLQLTKDLFNQNRDLQQFTYIVSHNLRAPVANIMGLVGLLSVTYKESVNFDMALGYLKTSINKMDIVLRDLNTILSIRDKGSTIEKEEVLLKTVCQQAKEELLDLLKECGGEVYLGIDESIRVRANRAYLFSIIYNLLSNAIKYRSPEKKLRVSIKCHGSNERGSIISFSDNGSGFDRKFAGDKVFQLYKRFHSNIEGKGLGLFLVKTHLEAMGGYIEVTSKPMEGTRFLIYLK